MNYFPSHVKELIKIPLQYIWNELAEDRESFTDWNELVSIRNIELILDELYQERSVEGLKEFMLDNLKK